MNAASPLKLRLATLLFPPLGLVLLWRSSASRVRKIFGTLGVLLYTFIYIVAICALLVKLHLAETEWKGGMGPRLVRHRTRPDFDAIEASRRAHTNAPLPAPTSGSTYWSDYRGPNRDGHYAQQPILTNWPKEGLKCLWRQPCGGGYASFAIAQGRAFTLEQRRDQEVVVAYDVATGRELWLHAYHAQFNDQWDMGGIGPRATPVWHEGRVYAFGAQGDLHCLEAATGKVLWKRNVNVDSVATTLTFGMSSTPLIVDDKIIVQSGSPPIGSTKSHGITAYHKISGEPVWHSQTDQQAYSSPMLVTLAGRRQILLLAGKRALGLAPEDGSLLWEFPWMVQYENHIAQPILLGGDKLFFSAGYGAGCVAVRITKAETGFKAEELWRNKFMKNKFTSSVFWQGNIYGLDEDILTCLNAETGERKWKDGRYGYGQVLLASGHLIVQCGEGDLALVRATPEKLDELARVPGITGKTWNNPAIADGKLLLRNAAEMACFDLSVPGSIK